MEHINLAIIGTGVIGSLYARICAQMQGVRVIALCALRAERVVPLARELGATAYPGGEYRRMLEEHPEVAAAIIATPEDRHVDPTLAALDHGKHILVEKPLASTVADAAKIVEAVRNKNVISMVAYSLRFDPRYVAMKQAVSRGEIGDVRYMVARRNNGMGALERIQGRSELPFWIGVHDIDMMRWVAGSDVERIVSTSTQKGFENWGVQGAFLTLLSFKNGAIALLENAWLAGSAVGSLQAQSYFKVQGTRGLIEVKSDDHSVTIHAGGMMYSPDTVYMPADARGHIVGVYRDQLDHFVHCVREGIPTDVPLVDGKQAVVVAEAICQSARHRREIVLG